MFFHCKIDCLKYLSLHVVSQHFCKVLFNYANNFSQQYCSLHFTKYFLYIFLHDPNYDFYSLLTEIQTSMLGSIYLFSRYTNEGLEVLSHLPEVTQLGTGSTRTRTQIFFGFEAKICPGITPTHLVQKLWGKNNYFKKSGLFES